jgi:integrase
MTPLQSRREQVVAAAAAHLAQAGSRDWKTLRVQFPDVPQATFWRCVRRAKLAPKEPAENAVAEEAPPEPRPVDPRLLLRWSTALVARRSPIPTDAERAAIDRLRSETGRAQAATGGDSPDHDGCDDARAPRFEGTITVGELMLEYEDKVLPGLRSGWSQRRSLTYIAGPLAHKTCADLAPEDIEPVVADFSSRAPTHAKRALAYFSAFCSWAVKQGAMPDNPARWIEAPVAEEPRDRSLNLDELVEVWQAAGVLGYPFGPAIRLLILTATRRQDIASMSREDLLRGEGGGLEWRILERNHGEREEFVVPLSPQAEAQIPMPRGSSNLVFTTTGSTPVSGWSKAKQRLDDTIQARRVEHGGPEATPMAPWRLNDLRQTFFDLSLDELAGFKTTLGRCLNRMRENNHGMARALAHEASDLDERRIAMMDWGAFIGKAVAEPPAKPVKSAPPPAKPRRARRRL